MGDGGNLENTGKEFTYTPMVTGAHFLKICKQFTILPNPNFIICSFYTNSNLHNLILYYLYLKLTVFIQ
jgi:hypothetical protein